jgi:hypothetical protein
MSEYQNIIRPNDRFSLPVQGAVNKIMVEILSGERLDGRKVKLFVKALEDACSADGSVLVSIGSTSWIEMDQREGFEFEPINV